MVTFAEDLGLVSNTHMAAPTRYTAMFYIPGIPEPPLASMALRTHGAQTVRQANSHPHKN